MFNMKILFKVLVLTVLVLSISGCKEKSITHNSSYLTANINGEDFSSTLEIVAFRAGGQTYLNTADNSGTSEYEFNLIIENNKGNDPTKKRYGFIELKNRKGDRKNNKMWALPNNFNFTITNDENTYIEGTFSFTAKPIGKNSDTQIDLVLTDGTFKANKKHY